MNLLTPFILQNFKKILRVDPTLRGCAILGAKMAHLSWTNFFGTDPYYCFHPPIGLFHYAKSKKKQTYSRPTVMRMQHFWAQNGPIAPNKFFFGKMLKSFSSTYWPLLLCKMSKKFFQRIQSYEDVHFLGPKWPISPNGNFLSGSLLMFLSFMPIYMPKIKVRY